MRLVFYCESTNRKTYGVNLDAPHHIHPGVISTKATEAVATFRQTQRAGPNDISSAIRTRHHTPKPGEHPIIINPRQKQERRALYTSFDKAPISSVNGQATNHSAAASETNLCCHQLVKNYFCLLFFSFLFFSSLLFSPPTKSSRQTLDSSHHTSFCLF